MLDELKPSSAAGPKANLELRRSSTAEPCSTLPIPILSEVGPGSAQHQIGQRDHGRRSADQDQGVVGSEVVLHVEEPLDFLGHEQRLGRGEQDLCEPPWSRSPGRRFEGAHATGGCWRRSRHSWADRPLAIRQEPRPSACATDRRHHGTSEPRTAAIAFSSKLYND